MAWRVVNTACERVRARTPALPVAHAPCVSVRAPLQRVAFGLPNRRRRVFIVASMHGDARDVLLTQVGLSTGWLTMGSARHAPAPLPHPPPCAGHATLLRRLLEPFRRAPLLRLPRWCAARVAPPRQRVVRAGHGQRTVSSWLQRARGLGGGRGVWGRGPGERARLDVSARCCRSSAGEDVVPTLTTSNNRMLLLLAGRGTGMLRVEDAERLQARRHGACA